MGNMGNKFILELPDGCNIGKVDDAVKLTPYTEPDLEQVRKEAYEKGWKEAEDHYEKGYNDGYDTGLSHAWEAARKVVALSTVDRRKVFGSEYMYSILEKHTASEAIEKIRQYEQEQQFHVGDEIKTQNGFKGFVIRANDKYVYFVDENREGCVETMMAAKTGRHFPEIAEVLKKMRDGE